MSNHNEATHIIYIPGFGDTYDGFRRTALRWWRYRNITVSMVSIDWQFGTFRQKMAAIDAAIDVVKDKKIVLVGESAGGGMAVYTYAHRPKDIARVVTICGKNTKPETVGRHYLEYSPAFRDLMGGLNAALQRLTDRQRRNIVSLYPFFDPVVPVRDTMVPGCQRVRLWTVGHLFTIFLALTFSSPFVVRAVRKR